MFTLEQKVDIILRYIATADKNQRAELKKAVISALESSKTIPDYETIIRDVITDVLKEIGTPTHLKGYTALVHAIELAVQDPDRLTYVTKGIYYEVAKRVDSTWARVERTIRHAIESTFDRGDQDRIIAMFGNTISVKKGKLTNLEFISFCEKEVRRRLRGSSVKGGYNELP